MIDLLLSLVGSPISGAAFYLGGLAFVAKPPRRKRSHQAQLLRFDVVVPAHNEARGIRATLESLARIRYPKNLWRAVVVADNCTDDTAAIARTAGAVVIERHEPTRRGKGYALELAFERSLQHGFADAVVVVDADSVVSTNLLHAFAERFAEGAQAVQAEYGVRNALESRRTRLMTIAFTLFHRVRSLARERMGLSSGLRGNGMGFSTSLLRQVPHRAFSLVEDAEYGVQLGLAGRRVCYVDEACVLGEMPAERDAARSQRQRWESGRLQLARKYALPLVRRAWTQKSLMLADLAIDLLVPPLATVATLSLALTLAAWLSSSAVAFGIGAASLSAIVLYVMRGWSMSGVGWRGLGDLAWSPVYVMWKLSTRSKSKDWVRTARRGEEVVSRR